MSKPKLPKWLFGGCSLVLGLAGALMVLTAFSTASLHFGHCGPSSFSSPEQYCRGASQLLIAGYGVLLASAVLAAVAVWLRVVRRGRL
jgi:hypothetical protein